MKSEGNTEELEWVMFPVLLLFSTKTFLLMQQWRK